MLFCIDPSSPARDPDPLASTTVQMLMKQYYSKISELSFDITIAL